MNIKHVLDGLAQQRNDALDTLVQVRAELLDAQAQIAEKDKRITELEAKPVEGATDVGPQAEA